MRDSRAYDEASGGPSSRSSPSSCRFGAAAPNEVWQSDFTHWRLADGTEVEILTKAVVAGSRAAGHFRLRYDVTDSRGAMTLRRAGRLHHLKIGAAHARRRVLAIVDEQEVTVVALETGEVLSAHRIEPDKGYWRNTRRDPGDGQGLERLADHTCRLCRDS